MTSSPKSEAYRQAQSLLRHMTDDELIQIASAARSLVAMGQRPADAVVTITDSSDWLVQCVFDVTRSLGVGTFMAQLQTTAKEKAVRQKIEEAKIFIERQARSKTERIALCRVGIRLLYDSLRWMDVPVTGSVLLRHLHRLPAVFDRHFPGYAASGMLQMLIKAEMRDGRGQEERGVVAQGPARRSA